MAATKDQRPVQQSILDRLLDAEPHEQIEPALTRSQSVRALKAALRRDLEWLLNTRRTVQSAEGFAEVNQSVFVYGLPDVTSVQIRSGEDEARLLHEMERAIAVFEPRLANVRVTSAGELTKRAQELRFHIEGLLLLDPMPELIGFDTTLDVSRGDYRVRD